MKAGLDDVEGETSITGALLRHLEMRMMNKKNLAEVRWRELIWNISVMLTLHLLLTGTIAVVMLRTIPHLFVYFQANLGLYILLVFLQFVVPDRPWEPCLYMYGSSVWAATETPEGSGRYASASIPMAGCSTSSPMACGSGNGAHGTIAGRVMSFGEDNNRDAFLFSTGGIYRVVRPALCHRPSTAGDEMNLLLTQPSTLTPMQAGGLLFVAGFVYVIRKLIPC